MTDYIKNLDTAIFTDPTGCGKVPLFLDLVEKEYNKHCIIIIFPTLQWNKILNSIILHHNICIYICIYIYVYIHIYI